MGRVRQPAPPLLPADAIPIAPAAGLVDGADGGAVFVFGQANFAFATENEVSRRLAAVQLVATGPSVRKVLADSAHLEIVPRGRFFPEGTIKQIRYERGVSRRP